MILPRIMIDHEDGIVTLQWQNDRREGVAIAFKVGNGDNDADVGYSGPGEQYADGTRSFRLSDGIPADVAARIAKL